MSYDITYNRTTHTGDGSTDTLTYEKLVTTDFAVTKNSQESVVHTNITSPLGAAETVETQYQPIADVYTNSGIDRAFWTPSKRGVALYFKVNQVWTVADASDTSAPEYKVPAQVTIRIKVPQNPAVSVDDIEQLYARAIALFEPDGTNRIAKMLRGSIDMKAT